jgi:PAS domain S-box-containing protein
VFIVADENLRDLRGPEQLANKANSQSLPTVPAPTKKSSQRHSPVTANTYVESVAGQARPCRRAPAGCGFDFSGAYVTQFFGQAGNLNRRRASQVAGFAAVTIAAAAFIGWWVSLPLPSSWGSGFATVKPTTALCLATLGLALMHPGKNARLAFAAGLAVVAIAALDLLDRFGIDLGINHLNHLLVPQAAVPGPETWFSMINGVPVGLTLAGSSLALSRFERYHFAATALGVLVGAMELFGLLAYLSGIHTLYGSLATPRPATAGGLLCVAVGVILRIGAMPALRKPRPLWHLLIMLGCAIIAPLLLFGVYTGFRITDAQLRDVRNNLISEARTLSADVDREVAGEIKRLRALAASSSLHQGDFAEFQRQAESSLASRQGGNITLVDRNMQQLVKTWVPFGRPLPKTAVPEPVQRALATGKPQITGLFFGPVTQQVTIGIIVPVEIDDESRYAIVRSPDRHVLAGLVAPSELPAGWQAAVSDAAHHIIVASDPDAFMGKELPRAQWHRAGPGGVSGFADSEGRPSLEAYAWSELTGWQTTVWAPTTLLEAPVRALWWTISFTALAAFALVVALASWLGRLIARSVGHAARAATTLGKGGPLPSHETPVAEVETLMAELRGAAARRQAAEDWLRKSKDRLQIALNVAQLGSYQYDPRHRVFSGGARCQEIFDFPNNETTIEEIMKLVHPDDVEMVQANLEAALDPVDPRRAATEFRLRRRDGEVRWVETLGLAYFEGAGDERGAVSFVGTLADITERKEREEKEHLLMREINHRAKNMLSVVDAIAHQTATRNPEDFVERFSERIQALSANQDLLVRNEWNGVEIEDLVHAQLALFADLIGSRIAVHGPKLRLKAASAQAIGLALHELATNAGKYGALSTDRGRVDVRWGTDGDTLTMSWTERDGPPVSAPKRRGFGTIVIEAMTERSVDGTVDLEYAPSGVNWRLTCPAANALEPGGM